MLIFSLTLCGISLNYFQKASKPFCIGAQLYLIFYNCVPRIMHNTLYYLLEIAAHIYIQDLARSMDSGNGVGLQIGLLEILGVLAPSLLETSGFIASPHYAVDFFKYNILYAINAFYIFYAKGDQWQYGMIGLQVFLMVLTIFNYLRKTLCLRRVHNGTKRAFAMAGGSADDARNVLAVEDTKINVLCFQPKKTILRSYEFKPQQEFAGYIAPSRLVVVLDKETENFLILDACNFQTKLTIKAASKVAYITHATKNLLAVFLPLQEETEGTLIKIFNLLTGEMTITLGLSHSIKRNENLIMFDSFLIDIDTSSDKILFFCNRMLCSLDIDSKVNESLCPEYIEGFTLLKANERRVVLSSKEDWVEMYDVPTNQPVALNNVFLSYSRIIPIRNLHNHYIVEPCCSKKLVYIMRGYDSHLQVMTYFNIGFPRIIDAFYVKDSVEIYFVEAKTNVLYRFPFSYGKGKDPFKLQDFEDSIVVLS